MIIKTFFAMNRDKFVDYDTLLQKCAEPGLVLNINLYALGMIVTNKDYRSLFDLARCVHVDSIGAAILTYFFLGRYFKPKGYRQWANNLFHDEKLNDFFFLGGTRTENSTALEVVGRKWKDIRLSGVDGYTEERKIISALSATDACCVIVGMGMPKQEFMMKKLHDVYPDKVYYAAGGWIKQLAGLEKECPKILIRLKLEWLHRSIGRRGHLTERVIKPLIIVLSDIIKK